MHERWSSEQVFQLIRLRLIREKNRPELKNLLKHNEFIVLLSQVLKKSAAEPSATHGLQEVHSWFQKQNQFDQSSIEGLWSIVHEILRKMLSQNNPKYQDSAFDVEAFTVKNTQTKKLKPIFSNKKNQSFNSSSENQVTEIRFGSEPIRNLNRQRLERLQKRKEQLLAKASSYELPSLNEKDPNQSEIKKSPKNDHDFQSTPRTRPSSKKKRDRHPIPEQKKNDLNSLHMKRKDPYEFKIDEVQEDKKRELFGRACKKERIKSKSRQYSFQEIQKNEKSKIDNKSPEKEYVDFQLASQKYNALSHEEKMELFLLTFEEAYQSTKELHPYLTTKEFIQLLEEEAVQQHVETSQTIDIEPLVSIFTNKINKPNNIDFWNFIGRAMMLDQPYRIYLPKPIEQKLIKICKFYIPQNEKTSSANALLKKIKTLNSTQIKIFLIGILYLGTLLLILFHLLLY